jgi:hypothetical protein
MKQLFNYVINEPNRMQNLKIYGRVSDDLKVLSKPCITLQEITGPNERFTLDY